MSAKTHCAYQSARSSFDYLSIFGPYSEHLSSINDIDHRPSDQPTFSLPTSDQICYDYASPSSASCPTITNNHRCIVSIQNSHNDHNNAWNRAYQAVQTRSLFLWVGLVHLLFALFLLGIDSVSNGLTESRFSVSSALASMFCSVFAFIVARSAPSDRASRLLLSFSCLVCLALCSFLFLENGHGLLISYSVSSWNSSSSLTPSLTCPALSSSKDMAHFLSLWPNDQKLLLYRPCLGPVLLSILFCASLIGISLTLFLLILSLRPAMLQQRFQQPFGDLIGRRRSRRRTVTKLPLLANKNKTVPEENVGGD